MSKLSDLYVRIWGHGVRPEFWTSNAVAASRMIQTYNLPPANLSAVSSQARTTEKAYVDLGIRGGMSVPHLHYKNRIYMLNDEQWAEFSESILANAKAKLAKVKEISFEDAVTLGSMVDSLAGK